MSREYKSDTFSMLMEDKNNALEVYNALNGSHYTDPEEVEIVRLEKGVSLSIRNDASFIIDMNISFYEHQASYNPNMPLRSLIYYANSLDDWIKKHEKDLFGSKVIQLPMPHFVVFYNGVMKRPEYEEMKLSDSFCHATDKPEIELICKVYNINPPHNQQLRERSSVLEGYSYFVELVRKNQQRMKLEEAVDCAIEDCIQNKVLADFFAQRGEEIRKVTHLDFTFEQREKLIRKEALEEGLLLGKQEGLLLGQQQGIQQGQQQGYSQARLEQIRKMISKGYTEDQILELDFTADEIKAAKKQA